MTTSLQRNYLAFRKLKKYCANGKFEQLGPLPIKNGRHDENSPILGVLAGQLLTFEKFVKDRPDYVQFGSLLYEEHSMIPAQDQKKADVISKKILDQYLKTYGLTIEGVTEDGYYFPPAIVSIHELGHIERTLPGSTEVNSASSDRETAIHELVLSQICSVGLSKSMGVPSKHL